MRAFVLALGLPRSGDQKGVAFDVHWHRARPGFGVHRVEGQLVGLMSSTTAVSTIDGRKTKPYSFDNPATVVMEDGGPVPEVHIPKPWMDRIQDIFDRARIAARDQCPPERTVAGSRGNFADPPGGTPGHSSNTQISLAARRA